MQLQTLQMAAYALIVAFFLLFGLLLFSLIQSYTEEESVPPSLSPAQQERTKALTHELKIVDYALALGLFLLVGLLAWVLAKKDEQEEECRHLLLPGRGGEDTGRKDGEKKA